MYSFRISEKWWTRNKIVATIIIWRVWYPPQLHAEAFEMKWQDVHEGLALKSEAKWGGLDETSTWGNGGWNWVRYIHMMVPYAILFTCLNFHEHCCSLFVGPSSTMSEYSGGCFLQGLGETCSSGDQTGVLSCKVCVPLFFYLPAPTASF